MLHETVLLEGVSGEGVYYPQKEESLAPRRKKLEDVWRLLLEDLSVISICYFIVILIYRH